MYKVYLDDHLLYHSAMTDEYPLAEAKVEQEVNKAGTFHFSVYENNPLHGAIRKMKSIVRIYDDYSRVFRGRVLNATRGMYNELNVTCEGELAFLIDSKVRPYSFEGTVEDYFTFLVTKHNEQVEEEKQFLIGECTVTIPNDLDKYIVRTNTEYPTTFDELNDKLVNELGGYLFTREENDGVYIDYLSDFDKNNNQKVQFGENLLNFEETIKGQDIATAIIPLGYKLKDEDGNETGKRLTIATNDDALDYVFDEKAVDKYGYIFKVVEFDDITSREQLREKGKEELNNTICLTQSIELSAVDLHALDLNIESFRIGRYTMVESIPHNFNMKFLTRKISINLLNPTDSILSLGDERQTFVDKQVRNNKILSSHIEKVEVEYKNAISESIQSIENLTTSKIEQSSDKIVSKVGSIYYTKDDVKEIIAELESNIVQTAEAVEFKILKNYADAVAGVEKFFVFNEEGLTIRHEEELYKVVIDNDEFKMMLKGKLDPVLSIGAKNGEIRTPLIIIEDGMKKMGYEEMLDVENRLNCIWVGDE